VLSHFGIAVSVAFGGDNSMLQKPPEAKCQPWTTEEIEELRSSLRTSEIADVDTEMFGKRLSEIIARTQAPGVKGAHMAEPDSNQRLPSP